LKLGPICEILEALDQLQKLFNDHFGFRSWVAIVTVSASFQYTVPARNSTDHLLPFILVTVWLLFSPQQEPLSYPAATLTSARPERRLSCLQAKQRFRLSAEASKLFFLRPF
jgi:hypothetical protein